MKYPDRDVLDDAKSINSMHVRFVKWLDDWKNEELNALPKAGDNIRTQQGRVQVLQELVKFVTTSSDMGAKS